mgnify:CR=1 FL=1
MHHLLPLPGTDPSSEEAACPALITVMSVFRSKCTTINNEFGFGLLWIFGRFPSLGKNRLKTIFMKRPNTEVHQHLKKKKKNKAKTYSEVLQPCFEIPPQFQPPYSYTGVRYVLLNLSSFTVSNVILSSQDRLQPGTRHLLCCRTARKSYRFFGKQRI